MVQLYLRLTAPVGQEGEVIQTLRTIMLPARLSRGCSRVELCVEVGQPGVLCYLEEWDDEEELVAQLRVERFSHLLELMECAVEPPFLEFRFVTARRGLDYIEAARSDTNIN